MSSNTPAEQTPASLTRSVRRDLPSLAEAMLLLLLAVVLSPIAWRAGLPWDERLSAYFPESFNMARDFWRGHIAHWNPYSFGGSPGLATHQFGMFYPPNLILFGGLGPVVAGKVSTVLHFWLTGCLMAVLLGGERLLRPAVLAGAVVWMASGHLMVKVGHFSHFQGACLAPGVFYFARRIERCGSWHSVAALALLFSLIVFAGYMQVAIFTAVGVGTVMLPYVVAGARRFRLVGMLAVAFALGGALTAVQLLPTLYFSQMTARAALTYEEFSKYYLPIDQWLMLVFPLIYGGDWSSNHPYTGMFNLAEITGWIGVVPVILAGWGAGWVLRAGRRRFVAVGSLLLAVTSFLFCLGPQTPVYRLMFEVPGYNLFRGAARNFFGVHLAVAVLCALGVHRMSLLLRHRTARRGTARRLLVVLCGALLVVGGLAVALGGGVHLGALAPTAGLAERLVPVVSVAASLALGAVFLYRCRRWLAVGLLLPFLLESAWLHDKLEPLHVESAAVPMGSRQAEMLRGSIPDVEDLEQWRCYPVRFEFWHGSLPGFGPSFHLYGPVRSLSGYGPLYPPDLITLFGMGSTGVVNNQLHMLGETRGFSLFNVRYVSIKDHGDNAGYPQALALLENSRISWPAGEDVAAWRELAPLTDGYRLFENPHAMPRVWSVRRLFTATNHTMDAATQIARSVGFLYNTAHPWRPTEEALFTGSIPLELAGEFTATVKSFRQNGPNSIRIRLEGDGPGFVVISENYMPGWSARVDDAIEVPIHRVNALLMGVATPPGAKRLELRYTAPGFHTGAGVSLAALVLLGVLAMVSRRQVSGSARV